MALGFLPSASDLREMSFQQVVDNVFKPNGVKVGGFPEEIFIDITEDEKERWSCGICFMVANEPSECDNKHVFCKTCIFAWTLTSGENSQRCPMCRCEMPGKYQFNKDLQKKMDDKRVACPETDCNFKAPLKIFLMHSHGKKRFSNGHVDLETLRPPRREMGARIMMFPLLNMQDDLPAAQRGQALRSQLQQGRAMINQMMLLLHLEMQLRQQALHSYSTTPDPVTRLHRLDEVLALNEQLNEVGGILSNLLSNPLHMMGQGNATTSTRDDDTDSSDPAIPPPRASGFIPTTSRLSAQPVRISAPSIENSDDDDDDDDSDSDSDDSDNTELQSRLRALRQRREAHDAARVRAGGQPSTSMSTESLASTSSTLPPARSRRPSEIRAGLSIAGASGAPSTPRTTPDPPRLQQRVLLQRSQEAQNSLRPRQTPSNVTVQRINRDQNNNEPTPSTTANRSSVPASLNTSTSGRTSLPAITTASPRTQATTSPRTQNNIIAPRNITSPRPSESSPTSEVNQPAIPRGSRELVRAMQGIEPGRASRAGRSLNGEFAASQLSGNPPPPLLRNRTPAPNPNQSSHQSQHARDQMSTPMITDAIVLPDPPVEPVPATSNGYAARQQSATNGRSRPSSSVQSRLSRGPRQLSESRPGAANQTNATRGRRTQSQSRTQATQQSRNQASRRQSQASNNANHGHSTESRTNRSNNATSNQTSSNRGLAPTRRSSTNASTNQSGGLPSTSGQLLRARRRSEIAQDLIRKVNQS